MLGRGFWLANNVFGAGFLGMVAFGAADGFTEMVRIGDGLRFGRVIGVLTATVPLAACCQSRGWLAAGFRRISLPLTYSSKSFFDAIFRAVVSEE